MKTWRVALAGSLGYVAGTMPSAAIAARLSGSRSNLSTAGSGNPGALNAGSELGPGWGVAVGFADITKGTVAAWTGRAIGGDAGCYAAATTAVAGHMYPPGRRGGRGVATSFGAVMVAFPLFAPIDLGLAAAVVAVRRGAPRGTRSAPAVLASASAFLFMSSLWAWKRWPNPGGPAGGHARLAYAVATAALVLPRWVALERRGPEGWPARVAASMSVVRNRVWRWPERSPGYPDAIAIQCSGRSTSATILAVVSSVTISAATSGPA